MRILMRFARVALFLAALVTSLPFLYTHPGSAQNTARANSQCATVGPNRATPSFFLQPTKVQIDVKPGNAKNTVAPNDGTVHVAICGEDPDGTGPLAPTFKPTLDVVVMCPTGSSNRCKDRPGKPGASVVPPTPTFGASGFEESLEFCCSERDVNGDGVKDLVLGFDRAAAGIAGTPNEVLILRGCCDTPEFDGANQVNCEVDCEPSCAFFGEGECIPPPEGEY